MLQTATWLDMEFTKDEKDFSNAYEDLLRDRIENQMGPLDNHLKILSKQEHIMNQLQLTKLALTFITQNDQLNLVEERNENKTKLYFQQKLFRNLQNEDSPNWIKWPRNSWSKSLIKHQDRCGPGIWRLINITFTSKYEFVETFLDQQTVNSANYDAFKQDLREDLRNICSTKSIRSKQ